VTVHHTPGHSDGHVCFVVEGEGIVLVGDHVLSYTTPNVSAWPWTEGDPLGSYLASLRKLEWFGAGMLGLPGHEERMAPVDGRASEIRRHHEEQLDGVMEIVGSGANTIADVAARMSWSRSWADLGPMDRVMALGEAHAHLRQLETREELERLDGRPARWQPVSAS
jgi:glyoxylase-like metal-dependent hydrolase (beta-lactamase superfamily II)